MGREEVQRMGIGGTGETANGGNGRPAKHAKRGEIPLGGTADDADESGCKRNLLLPLETSSRTLSRTLPASAKRSDDGSITTH